MLKNNAAAPGINIYIPRNYDLNLPINNNLIRFKISSGTGNFNSCSNFVQDGVSECKVDSATIGSYQPTTAKITVSGLGRINGWNALNEQKQNGYIVPDYVDLAAGDDVNIWKNNAKWYIDGENFPEILAHVVFF